MDTIILKGLEIFAHHGVLAEEKRDGQIFVLDAVLHADLSRACTSDKLEETVNYAEAAELIRRVMTEEDNQLIERAAQRVADALLDAFPRLAQVDITLKKPSAPMPVKLAYAGITISRRRAAK